METLGEQFGREFERSLLHLLLFDKHFAAKAASGISEDQFEVEKHQEIVAVFIKLLRANNGTPPSYKTVHAELHNLSTELEKDNKNKGRARTCNNSIRLIEKLRDDEPPSYEDQKFIETKLSSFVTYRAMQAAYFDSINYHEGGEYDVAAKVLEEAAQTGKLLLDQDIGIEYTDAKAKIESYLSREEADMHACIGVPLIDRCMRGGLEPKHLGILLAGTGVGKTMGLVNIGTECLLAGLNVVHITLEISDQEVAYRYDARLTGHPINTLMDNLGKYEKTIRDATQKLEANLFIKEWGSDEVSAMDVRAYLKMLEARIDVVPDVILVDYADLLRPVVQRKDLRIELKDTMRALRQISKDWNCAVWTASQTNREGWEQERISLKTIAEAWEKATISDVIIAMCQTHTEKRKNKMRLMILKNRQGGHEGFTVDCKAYGDTQLIKESPQQFCMQGVTEESARREEKRGKQNRRKLRDEP